MRLNLFFLDLKCAGRMNHPWKIWNSVNRYLSSKTGHQYSISQPRTPTINWEMEVVSPILAFFFVEVKGGIKISARLIARILRSYLYFVIISCQSIRRKLILWSADETIDGKPPLTHKNSTKSHCESQHFAAEYRSEWCHNKCFSGRWNNANVGHPCGTCWGKDNDKIKMSNQTLCQVTYI